MLFRSSRIAKVKSVLDASTPELLAAQAEWEKTQVTWTVLNPQSAESPEGTTLTIRPDGSILASGKNPATDTYTVVVKNVPARVTAIRLELLPDDSLPKKGPGRAGNGNCVLSEFAVSVKLAAGEERRRDLGVRRRVPFLERDHRRRAFRHQDQRGESPRGADRRDRERRGVRRQDRVGAAGLLEAREDLAALRPVLASSNRVPVMPAPQASPTNPRSQMGVSHSRSAPCSSYRPLVVTKLPPRFPIPSPITKMAGLLDISPASASSTA